MRRIQPLLGYGDGGQAVQAAMLVLAPRMAGMAALRRYMYMDARLGAPVPGAEGEGFARLRWASSLPYELIQACGILPEYPEVRC
jgi:hypothetical protein